MASPQGKQQAHRPTGQVRRSEKAWNPPFSRVSTEYATPHVTGGMPLPISVNYGVAGME